MQEFVFLTQKRDNHPQKKHNKLLIAGSKTNIWNFRDIWLTYATTVGFIGPVCVY